MPKAKCDVCTQRKGKRACPARGGASICPRCCAQNRVTEFDCPADCPFLGAEGSLKLAAKGSQEFTPPTLDVVDGLLTAIVESEPQAKVMSDAEPTALAALEQPPR